MKDQISALMDGELALNSSEHIFTAIKAGGEMASCWSTYHLIGDVKRGNALLKPDFNERLMQKQESERDVLAPTSRR